MNPNLAPSLIVFAGCALVAYFVGRPLGELAASAERVSRTGDTVTRVLGGLSR